MEPKKPQELSECRHGLKYSPDNDVATTVHWDCVKCGAVAYFGPPVYMFIPRES